MSIWRAGAGDSRRRGTLRHARAVVPLLLAAALLPSRAGASREARADLQSLLDVPEYGSCAEEVGAMVRTAVALAGKGNLDGADTVLADALDRCPDHPDLLGGLAGLRLLQGHLSAAEALATHLVRTDPGSSYAWDLLAAIRYLRDDAGGALRAWSRGRPPVVREVEIRIHGPAGLRDGPDPDRMTGITPGRPLTAEGLVRGSRRLAALPAAARARLGYRLLPGGQAAIEGTVLLRERNPFTVPSLLPHAVRLLARRVQIVSVDPLGRLERWELSGSVEGGLRRAALALDHPAPAGRPGVWRWEVAHEVGRYGPAGRDEHVREERTGVGWSHADWLTASLGGRVHGLIDVRPGRGTFAGAGVGWTFLPLTGRSSIGAEGMGWVKVGGEGTGGGESGRETRFGRVEVRAALHPMAPPAAGAPAGVIVRVGGVAVSSRIPPDLIPRIGAGGNTALLMRARSDLDEGGVVRSHFPGTAWAHGGVELLRPVGSVGPVDIGVAAFADGLRVLARDRRSADPAARRGAVHLGAGARARVPGIDGWLRVDWGVDPVDGASTVSAAWFRGYLPGS